ncbi:Nucleolar Complex 2 protein, partial [Dimargaris verticillata]
MGKIKKSTKKFMKEGLGKAIEHRRKVQKVKSTREKQKAQVKARTERTLARHQAQDLKDEQNNILKYPRTKSRDLESFALVSGGQKKAGHQAGANSSDSDASSDTAHGSDADATNDFGIELDSNQESDADASDWEAMASDQEPVADEQEDSSTEMAVDDRVTSSDPKTKPMTSSDPVKGELVAHKAVLDRLEADDPEFYAYLQSNDRELLDFDVSASEGSDEDASEEEDDNEEDNSSEDDTPGKTTRRSAGKEQQRPVKSTTLTQDMIAQWSDTLSKDHDLTVTYQMLQAFESVA